MKYFLICAALFYCTALNISAQNTTVSGKVTAAGGGMIKIAHVHAMSNNSYKPIPETFTVNENGTFSFSLRNGWYRLQFSGVDYTSAPERPVEVYCSGQPIEITAELEANAAPSAIDSVLIITDLTKYDFSKAINMTKQPNGTFTAEFTTSKPTISYQVLVFGGDSKGEHSINGTMSDSYEYDGGGDYRSILNVKNGSAKIVFDPKKLPTSSGKSKVEFKDAFSLAVKAILLQKDADRQEFFAAYGKRKTGKPENYDPKTVRARVRKDIAAEENPILREIQMIRYLAVPYFSDDTTGADPVFAKEILTSIPAFSSVWGQDPRLIGQAIFLMKDKSGYLEQALKENSSVYVKSEVLSSLLEKATKDKDDKKLRAYYDQLMKEFPDTYAARYAAKQYNPDRKVKEGNIIPNFSFDGVDEETGKKITPASLKGKWVLIDNWATWCGPCVAEMPALHKVYEKFKDKNFVVLSVSFDRQAADVTKFRGGKFKMPWMHSFSEGVWESEAAKVFEVSGIPKPILIDPTGKIVALEEALRSDNLEKTLTKYVK
ncbi:MAG: redoxin domain-containing protein [Ignavibacteria bacterium]|nr:redoxin domain-containing protein [Ignavibacteria bacterium]